MKRGNKENDVYLFKGSLVHKTLDLIDLFVTKEKNLFYTEEKKVTLLQI